MFKLNRLTKTKKGDKVTPYLIQDGVVFAFDSNKNTVTLKLDDFEVNSPKKRRVRQPVVMVKGTVPQPEDERINKKAFNLNESGGLGGVYSEQPHILKPPTTITTPQEATIIPDVIEIVNDDKVEFVNSTEPGADPISTFESEDYEVELPRRDYTYDNETVSLKSSGKSKHYLLAVEDVVSSIDADDFYGGL